MLVRRRALDNHNGGLIVFGPDGYLYIGLGDGGGGGDPDGTGPELETLLGAILRIDVSGGRAVHRPVRQSLRRARRAARDLGYGLRNPWRFSFDRAPATSTSPTSARSDLGRGQRRSRRPRAGPGDNYGWSTDRGAALLRGRSELRPAPALTLPVVEYGHDQGCSITGGYVYRGAAVPALHGQYLYADFCPRFVRSFPAGNPSLDGAPDARPHGNITSFGEDASGEIYIVTADGRVLKIVPQ